MMRNDDSRKHSSQIYHISSFSEEEAKSTNSFCTLERLLIKFLEERKQCSHAFKGRRGNVLSHSREA